MNSVKKYYTDRIRQAEAILFSVKRKIYITGTLRLFVFLGIILLAILLRNLSIGLLIGIITLGLIPFVFLVVQFTRLQKKKEYLETSLRCDKEELRALDLDLSSFDGAPEETDTSHSYSLDLDLFGNKNSLFQLINRTCTNYGRKTLIRFFKKTLNEQSEIEYRQEIVSELKDKPDLLHHFRVTGLIKNGTPTDYAEIKEFVHAKNFIDNRKLWKTLLYIVPLIWIVFFISLFFGYESFPILVWLYIGTLTLSELPAKKVNRLQQFIGKKVAILQSYSGLIRILENETFLSEGLVKLQSRFSGKQKASRAIEKLATLANELEQRGNTLIHIILNPLMLWDVRKSIRIEEWKEETGEDLIVWIRNVGTFDSYVSLSSFGFNNPGYVFPTFTDSYFRMRGKELGHPLMNPEVCIRNDVFLDKASYFLVVTGANMAGKSTYLRTVGVNFVLACMGVPVCAKELVLYPAELVTSLRTSDSLNDNESYFFAELKRLKMIIDRLENGEKLFIILDEILKGTNSVDKQKGSLALVRQFVRLRSNGIIATHDLLLGELEKDFPEHIKNYRFEADIKDEQLLFSYKLRLGIAQNMNASFLMKKMGITL
jgi:Mismatch repair ATPase (MutS family)